MKIETELLIEFILDELKNEKDKTLQRIFGYFKTHPLVRNSNDQYTLNDISEIIYTVYFKLQNYDDNKIYNLLSNRVFYTIVSFGDINTDEVTCSECYGDSYFSCQECDGTGELESDDSEEFKPCDNCWGDGQVECVECDGTGYVSGIAEMGYSFHLLIDIQPETIINDMERADRLTDEFDVEVSDSPYEFTANSGDYQYLNENDFEYDSKYEGRVFFYEVVNGEETVNLNKPLPFSLN